MRNQPEWWNEKASIALLSSNFAAVKEKIEVEEEVRK